MALQKKMLPGHSYTALNKTFNLYDIPPHIFSKILSKSL